MFRASLFGPCFLLNLPLLPQYTLCVGPDSLFSKHTGFIVCYRLLTVAFCVSDQPSLLSPASLQGHISFLTPATRSGILSSSELCPQLSYVCVLCSRWNSSFSVNPSECLVRSWEYGGGLVLRNLSPLKINLQIVNGTADILRTCPLNLRGGGNHFDAKIMIYALLLLCLVICGIWGSCDF